MDCLTLEVLESMEHGRLAPELAARVRLHLEGCDGCRKRLASLEGARTIADRPRAQTAEPPTEVGPGVLPGMSVGRYLVVSEVGAGGMGAVYRAHDPELDRDVALKLLSPKAGGQLDTAGASARLVREAQALARLAHPNVVAIYDVGTHGHQVFLAMELVQGVTLRQWLKGQQRPWQEVLARFLAAGEGLQAAHDAGLMHRDFKPANVLLGDDGRVRVLDFGLARAVELTDPEAPIAPDASTQSLDVKPLETPLTRDGTVTGTPGYIAPEIFLGGQVDARVDQFSFAVALHEALYGQPPFERASLSAHVAALARGPAPRPPPGSKVPAWLYPVVQRALSTRPEDRFPAMRDLLVALRRTPVDWRRRAVVAVGAVGVGAAAVVGAFWLAARPCELEPGRAHALWTPQAHARLTEGASTAQEKELAGRALKVLDDYVAAWTGEAEASCGNASTKSRPQEALRRACLDRALGEFEALVTLLGSGDASLLEQAVPAARSLTAPSRCAESAFVARIFARPSAPTQRAVDLALRSKLATVRALMLTGKLADCAQQGQAVAQEAKAARLADVEAEALGLRGRALVRLRKRDEAIRALLDALAVSQAAGNEFETFQSAARVARTLATGHRPKEGEPWLKLAEAIAARMADDELATAALLEAQSAMDEEYDRFELSSQRRKKAVEILSRHLGPDHPDTLAALSNLGNTYASTGDLLGGARAHIQVADTMQRNLGADYPPLHSLWNNIGYFLGQAGEFSEGAKYIEACIDAELRRDARSALAGLCYSSLPYIKARATSVDAGLEAAQRGQELIVAEYGEDSTEVADLLATRGRVYLLQGLWAQALADCGRNVRIYEASARGGYALAEGLGCMGKAHAGLGQLDQARSELERALAFLEKGGSGPERAPHRFHLAQVLVQQKKLPEALELARKAADEWAPFPGFAAEHDAAVKFADALEARLASKR